MGVVFYGYSLSNLIFNLFFLFSTIIVSGEIRMLLRLFVQAQEKVVGWERLPSVPSFALA